MVPVREESAREWEASWNSRTTSFGERLNSSVMRWTLLTFPNSGSSMTLKLSQCVSGRSMCNTYNQNPKGPRKSCGQVSYRHRLKPAGSFQKGVVLVQSHGLHYSTMEDATESQTEANALSEYLARDAPAPLAVMRIIRNPYDTLVSRYHLAIGSSRATTWTTNLTFDNFARRDVCTMLQWYHLAHHVVIQNNSTLTFQYEAIVSEPERFTEFLRHLLQPAIGETASQCALQVRRHSFSIGSGIVPMHADVFSVELRKIVDYAFRQYRRFSNDFEASKLVPCYKLKTPVRAPIPARAHLHPVRHRLNRTARLAHNQHHSPPAASDISFALAAMSNQHHSPPLSRNQLACYFLRYEDLRRLVAKQTSQQEREDVLQYHWVLHGRQENRSSSCTLFLPSDISFALAFMKNRTCPPSNTVPNVPVPASPVSLRIPRRIMQTGKDCADAPVAGWRALNPGWDYSFFDDDTARGFLGSRRPEALDAFDCIIPGAFKADVLRLAWLAEVGGVFVDGRVAALELRHFACLC